MKILIVEDEVQMQNSINTHFSKVGYVCDIASTQKEAERKINLFHYDCIILDIELSIGNGLMVLKNLKKKGTNTGVIIISAKTSIDDKITGLTLGADDYLPKPFNFAELNARIISIVRRLKFKDNNNISAGNIFFNLESKKVFVNDQELTLKKKDYELLFFLAVNKHFVVSKHSLIAHIWGENRDRIDSFEFLHAQVKNIRQLLTEYGAEYRIKTIYDMGYKFTK